MQRIGYSYLRYSSAAQQDGDSVRRQTSKARDWCERNGVTLNTSTTYQDKGVSAFHGRHREKGVLGRFLADVEDGRIPRGSVLVVENLDRLSREIPWDAVPLLCSIVNAGITVVTLTPSEMTFQRGRDMTPLIVAVCEFGRGNTESAVKGERVAAAWSEKRKQARENGVVMTKSLPSWIEQKDGKLKLIPARVKIVRDIFRMCNSGMGIALILRHLVDTKTPALGRSGVWNKQTIHRILTGRSVLGEWRSAQPKEGEEPIANYYPSCIDVETWKRAQAAIARRKDKPGRIGHKVASLFSGLLWDARTHSRMAIASQNSGSPGVRRRNRVLMSADALEGKAKVISFPYAVFEEAVLSLLREVNVKKLLGDQPESEADLLTIEHDGIKARIRAIEEKLVEADEEQGTFMKVLRSLNEKRQDVLKRLVVAQQREANPVSGAWTEAQTLLDAAKDEAKRLRLRELLRIIVTEAWVLVVPIKSRRLCVVQFHFDGGARRDYLIDYHAASRWGEGGWEARSFADASIDFDLRDKNDATELERVLIESVGCIVG
jgi:DNA invertase Pin-like site-specific DNA recombinase